MLSKIGILVMAALLNTYALHASEATTQVFQKANQFYSNGNYAEAISGYMSLIRNGHGQGSIYYNLGNAYMKQGELGRAYASYLKASRLLPHDEDVQYNLRFVKSRLPAASTYETQSWFEKIQRSFARTMPTSTWFAVSCLLFWGSCISFALYHFQIGSISWSRRLLIICLVSWAIIFVGFVMSFTQDHGAQEAIIVRDNIPLRYEPSFDGAVAFKIREGSLVRVVRQEKGWVQVSLSDKENGWAPLDFVEVL